MCGFTVYDKIFGLYRLIYTCGWTFSKILKYIILPFFQVETSTGSVIPSCFDRTSRCPDEIVRRIRVTSSYEDHSWNGKLLETYDTQTDQFRIAPCHW